MKLNHKTLASSAAIGALALAGLSAGGASAATVVSKVICTQFCPAGLDIAQPLLPGSSGTVPSFKAVIGNTYDFVFTVAPPGGTDVLTQLEASAVLKKNGAAIPELIDFTLYSGTPKAVGANLGSSPLAYNSDLAMPLAAGKYFMQLSSSAIAVNKELVSGGVDVAGIPEPAAWSMMIMGLALMGAGLRQRRTAFSPA